ncbi:MAG TPA: 4Fe-4S dicluster domain-containing protein [Proteobacteria bacterium]|nr:4Fe-4S dicluster domain-containing protein [Pseudomonadota bacterium]
MEPVLFGFGLHTVVRGKWIKRLTLYLFARFVETPLLKITFWATQSESPFSRSKLLKTLAKATVARLMSKLDTGVPTPLERALEIVEMQDGPIAVGPCRCRSAHRACSHPLETDIVIRHGTQAFKRAFPKDYRIISKEEAKAILQTCRRERMFHMVFVHCPAHDLEEYVVCNCCTDGCVPYLANRFFGQDGFSLIKGEYEAYVERDVCRLCGECVDACPWDARRIANGRLYINADSCMGCGLCKIVCPTGAARIKRVRTIDWAALAG